MNDLLKFLWERLFQAQFPFRTGELRSAEVESIKRGIAGRIEELSSTDKDRAMMWHKLKSCQRLIREKDELAAEFRRRLWDAQNQIEKLISDMKASERCDCERITRLLPDSALDNVSHEIGKDELYELLALHIQLLQEDALRTRHRGQLQDVSVVTAERDAAYSEIRVLQARISALSAVPGRVKALTQPPSAVAVASLSCSQSSWNASSRSNIIDRFLTTTPPQQDIINKFSSV